MFHIPAASPAGNLGTRACLDLQCTANLECIPSSSTPDMVQAMGIRVCTFCTGLALLNDCPELSILVLGNFLVALRTALQDIDTSHVVHCPNSLPSAIRRIFLSIRKPASCLQNAAIRTQSPHRAWLAFVYVGVHDVLQA